MKLYLIDGNSYVYRAFFAIRGLTNSRGVPTNAIFGFTNMLMKIIRQREPDAMAVAFDTPHPTERHEIYEHYKAHRPETPDELVAQMPHVKKVIRAMGIPIFEMPGFEADDVLGTLARRASEEGHEVYIVTADKDMLQLVDERVRVYDPMKDRVLDTAYVLERFSVPPGRVTEYMALVGDASDNIPGVKGIGEKTAKQLLGEFSSLAEMLEHPERIKRERTRKLITEGVEDLMLSKKLAEINRQAPIEVRPGDLRREEPDWQAVMGLFTEYEFTSLMKLIPSPKAPERPFTTVLDEKTLLDLFKGVRDVLAFDTETTGTDPMRDTLVGYSVCPAPGVSAYVPVAHTYIGAPAQIEKKAALEPLAKLLGDEAVAKVGHNIKFDISVMRGEGITVRGRLYDTMLASHLLNPERAGHSLESATLDHLHKKKLTYAEVAGRDGFENVDVQRAAEYSSEDAEAAMELKGVLFERLRAEGLDTVYFDIEEPLIPVLVDMEREGMKIDADALEALSGELDAELQSIKKRVFFLAGEEFNINSPKQLSRVLFQALGLKPGKKKKTGYSTDVSVLEELSREHELPGEVLNWRSLIKLKGTYVDVLPGLVNPVTGRVHTSFNQAATATGRLSSSNPNLQNIPVRGEWGTRIREAFVPERGAVIVSADYSQIELRILAHLSGDPALAQAFREGIDVHTRTASEIFGVDVEKVDAEMRRVAKTVNFGVVYGITPFGLSDTLGVPRFKAAEFIEQYYDKHQGVKEYQDEVIEDARERGYVETVFGRRRPVPELKSRNANQRLFGQRLAVNSPVQGTAADIIKIAMINISRRLGGSAITGRMILQVHDELVFECPRAEARKLMGLVKEEMEAAASLDVPLQVEVGSGPNWARAHS